MPLKQQLFYLSHPTQMDDHPIPVQLGSVSVMPLWAWAKLITEH